MMVNEIFPYLKLIKTAMCEKVGIIYDIYGNLYYIK